jgi:putative spermidine/putrescine transport system substrate-binding protein
MDPFAAKTGIRSEIQLQGGSMETLAKLRTNKSRIEDDLWMSAIAPAALAMQDGLLERIPVDKLTNAADLPAPMVNETFVGVWALPYGIIYNAEKVPFEIKTWEDLFDPRLKGRVSGPYGANYKGLFIALLALLAGGNETNADPGFELAKKLKPNFSMFTTSDAEQVRLLTAGETDVAAFAPISNYFSARKAGPQFRFVAPKPYVPVGVNNIVILKDADVNAATRFIDFAVSKEPQEKIAEMLGCLPVNKKAQFPLALRDAISPDTELRYIDEAAITPQLAKWDDRWQREVQR